MTILSQSFMIIGVVLLLADILYCFRYFILPKNAEFKNSGWHILLTLLVLFCMTAILIYGCTVYSLGLESGEAGLYLFAVSLLATFMNIWIFEQGHCSRESFMAILEALIGVIEAGDPNLEGHSLHVCHLTMLLYDHLPITRKLTVNKKNLAYAALLLDIGKLGIPKDIINKSGKFDASDRAVMRRHPEIGVKILKSVPSFDKISSWIQYHHERMDGGGYYHLEGTNIPFESRMIAVADTYSALTMKRTYKASLGYDEAVSALKLAAGRQLDPELVEIFCQIPMQEVLSCMNEMHEKMKNLEGEQFR